MNIHKIMFAACIVGTVVYARMACKEALVLLKEHKTN